MQYTFYIPPPKSNANHIKELSNWHEKLKLFNRCSIVPFNYNIKMLLHLFPVPSGQHRTLFTELNEDFKKIYFVARMIMNILTSKKQKLCNIWTTLTYWWNALFKRFIFFFLSAIQWSFISAILLLWCASQKYTEILKNY